MISYKCSNCDAIHERKNDDITLSGDAVVIRRAGATCSSCQAVHAVGSRHPLANKDQAREEIEKQLVSFGIQRQTVDDFF